MSADLDRAAAMALLTLKKLQISTLPVDPMAILRQCRRTKVYTWKEYCALIAERFPVASRLPHPEAMTQRYTTPAGLDYWIVYFDDKMLRYARYNFSVAHELGHIVLKHTGTSPEEEREADTFASHLLVPRPVLSCIRHTNITDLCATFGVSESCMRTVFSSPACRLDPVLTTHIRNQFAILMEA